MVDPDQQDNVVSLLNFLLTRAKMGVYHAVAISAYTEDHTFTCAWSGGVNIDTHLAAAAKLTCALVRADENPEDCDEVDEISGTSGENPS